MIVEFLSSPSGILSKSYGKDNLGNIYALKTYKYIWIFSINASRCILAPPAPTKQHVLN